MDAVWDETWAQVIESALVEDSAWRDLTTEALIPKSQRGEGWLTAKAEGVVAGMEVAMAVFRQVEPSITVRDRVGDGTRVAPGDKLGVVEGPVAGILRGERVALNFLQRLSGIATETARYVAAVSGTRAEITDTRKTTPGLRSLEKYAVRVGGGRNHRLSLSDGILIKDNHLVALRASGVGVREAVALARERGVGDLKVEVEVESVEEAREALSAGADVIMLDNMNADDMREAVLMARGVALVEASGGITLDNVRAVAETGVDLISVGALTHSAKALDISLELRI